MVTNLNLSVQNKQDVDIFFNIFILGILTALINKKISIDDAEKLIFRPGVVDYLSIFSIDKKTIDLVMLGTELEDIESLVPEQLNEEIKKLIDITIVNLSNKRLLDNISLHIEL